MEITRTILAISMMSILATGVITPGLVDVYAYPLKADNSDKLKAKSFGIKTKDKIPFNDLDSTKSNFDSMKKEQLKTYKKIMAEYNAKQLLKKLYKLG